MSFRIVIPARYASTRLPAKALADIAGKPMVVRVAERAAQSGAESVYVATDHDDVRDVVTQHGYTAIMTRADHPSGTDRIAEVAEQLGWADDVIVVNVQGDEPLIDPALIARVASELQQDTEAAVATAGQAIHSLDDFLNPNVVKVVCDARGYAMYFSRAPIPYARDAFASGIRLTPEAKTGGGALPAELPALRHIGLYGYRVSFLRRYGSLAPSPLEHFEALEQLRALWHGYRIRVIEVDQAPEAGVDTEEDLNRVRRRFMQS